ncbi:MAG: tRNA (adenosine(37)-N6)-threonylcarbamoyltransferase complex transferase subunit TsaD [Desulfovibrionaceae bacterium]|nr:tRNA (adenosine(37)-N6)-threonylcarbamoyltransferase complex transferase subunit TsaD [Desulfovibrionaceae bacterium]
MLVLGIESSCDETALALVNDEGELASVMASQVDVHALFGGVVPELASREHARLIGPLLDHLLEKIWRTSGLGWANVDRIAVTRGPGLLGSLLVGLAFAKALALGRGLPLIGVNHLHAHLLVAGMPPRPRHSADLPPPPGQARLEFPALGVLVSGGHTHLYRMDGSTKLLALGRTLDDAAGEACDKFAKMAGLPYPGGALLDALGSRGRADGRLFPRPYTQNENLDFSFSGLKTAGAAWLAAHPDARFSPGDGLAREGLPRALDAAPQNLCDAAASYLLAVAETLVIKARRAATLFRPRSVVLAGGVAANSVVRRLFAELADEWGIPLLAPPPALCTDNGVMVAWNGLLLAREGLRHGFDLSAVPRGRPLPEDWLREESPLVRPVPDPLLRQQES